MKLSLFLAVVSLTLSPNLSAVAHAARYTAKSCSYTDLKKNVTVDGPCSMQDTTVNGHFAYQMTFRNGVKVLIEYVGSQSGAHTWRINGETGMGFEESREHLIGGTLDLNQLIEWQDR